ncbi:MAG: hypothetical protein AAGA31_03585 [Bacteroidota bacterium]
MPSSHLSIARLNWARIKQDQAKKGVVLQEIPDLPQWHPLFEDGADLNARLHLLLKERASTMGEKLLDWQELKADGNWVGFVLPLRDIDSCSTEVLQLTVEQLLHRRHHLSWREYLEAIGNEAWRVKDVPIVLIGLWGYVQQYNKFFATIAGQRIAAGPTAATDAGGRPFW